MATDKPTPPEGFEPFESETDGDEPTVELDPGEVIEGVVLDLVEGEYDDGGTWYRLKIKDQSRGVVRYFAKGQAKRAASEGRIEVGEPIWVAMDTEQDSFEDGGETVEYYPTKAAFPGGA
jgi:hypothetical protein